ncbi:SDR family NAD(P)-dependent oxidoreductase [Pseudonocardia aurantiaca]
MGCPLVLVGRDRDRLAAVRARTGGRAVVADLGTARGVESVAEAAVDWVELLIHVAGIGWAGPLADTPATTVDELMAVNLGAPVQLTRALLPTLRAADGHVVFVASIAAIGVANEAVYAATKAGLRGFADAVRLESGVGVTTVLPGVVATEYFRRRGTAYHRRFPRMVPPQRVAAGLVGAVEGGKAEVFVPRWLTLGARVHGAAPATFARLSRRFDPPAR